MRWALLAVLLWCQPVGCYEPAPVSDSGGDDCERGEDLYWCLEDWSGCLHVTCEEVEANHFLVADVTVRGAGLYVWPADGYGRCEDRAPGYASRVASDRIPPESVQYDGLAVEWGVWDVWPSGWTRTDDGVIVGSPGACPEGGLVKLAVGGDEP